MAFEEIKAKIGSGLLSFPITDFGSDGEFDAAGYAGRLQWLESDESVACAEQSRRSPAADCVPRCSMHPSCQQDGQHGLIQLCWMHRGGLPGAALYQAQLFMALGGCGALGILHG